MTDFTSFIKVPRNLFDELQDGELTIAEYLLFTVLIARANWKVGVCRTNAVALQTQLNNQYRRDWIVKVLNRLEDKGLIAKNSEPGKRGSYNIWIEGYVPTAGDYEGKRLNAVASRDSGKITFHQSEQRPSTELSEAEYKPSTELSGAEQRPRNIDISVDDHRSSGDVSVETKDVRQKLASTPADKASSFSENQQEPQVHSHDQDELKWIATDTQLCIETFYSYGSRKKPETLSAEDTKALAALYKYSPSGEGTVQWSYSFSKALEMIYNPAPGFEERQKFWQPRIPTIKALCDHLQKGMSPNSLWDQVYQYELATGKELVESA